jgi:hypothetical protein
MTRFRHAFVRAISAAAAAGLLAACASTSTDRAATPTAAPVTPSRSASTVASSAAQSPEESGSAVASSPLSSPFASTSIFAPSPSSTPSPLLTHSTAPKVTTRVTPKIVPKAPVTLAPTVKVTPKPTVKPKPAPTTRPKAPIPTPTPTPSIVERSATGFPTSADTGVPRSQALTTNNTTRITASGQTLTGQRLGCLTIDGNNNTIQDSVIQGSGEMVCLQLNGYGNRLINDTIEGSNSGGGAVQYAVRDFSNVPSGGAQNLLQGDYVHFCTQCIYSSVTKIFDSFVDVDASVGSTHYEAIYNPGGGPGMDIQHSTIGNEHDDQTAAYYSAPDNGEPIDVTINDSYLYGGGYVIYAGETPDGGTVRNVVLTNNVIGSSQFGWLYPYTNGLSCSGNHTSSGASLSCS